ncbi:hypothetical protein GCM10009634_86790 [Saccharothrix xinjiangensis]
MDGARRDERAALHLDPGGGVAARVRVAVVVLWARVSRGTAIVLTCSTWPAWSTVRYRTVVATSPKVSGEV